MQAKLQARGSMSLDVVLIAETQYSQALQPLVDFDPADFANRAFTQLLERRCAGSFLTRAGAIQEVELCIRVVDEPEGKALNHEWRGKESATNVLSFAAEMIPDEYAALGDLVLCAPVVEREATEQGKSVGDHYRHLLVHGLLHLLGYDHVAENEAKEMEFIEVAVLGELGVANPYE